MIHIFWKRSFKKHNALSVLPDRLVLIFVLNNPVIERALSDWLLFAMLYKFSQGFCFYLRFASKYLNSLEISNSLVSILVSSFNFLIALVYSRMSSLLVSEIDEAIFASWCKFPSFSVSLLNSVVLRSSCPGNNLFYTCSAYFFKTCFVGKTKVLELDSSLNFL